MDFDYRKRGYLLPNGCKDLIDVDKQTAAEVVVTQVLATKNNFIVTARLPELRQQELEILTDGRFLRIVGHPGGSPPFENVVEVPHGYLVEAARAVYIMGNLRIVVPKNPRLVRSKSK